MRYCPSMDWDRYCRDNDPPEVCPMCRGENADEDGNPICSEAPDFCSVECAREYATMEAEADNDYAKALIEEERIAAEWKKMCEEQD